MRHFSSFVFMLNQNHSAGPVIRAVAGAILVLSIGMASGRPDTGCDICDSRVVLSGQFHLEAGRNVPPIAGLPPGGERAFRSNITGKQFSLAVSQLNPGRYTAVIGVAETVFDHAGARRFDIACGNRAVASNLDVFAVSGGLARAFFITNLINFPGDGQNGPLVFTFTGRVNDAELNWFELRDAAGQTVLFRPAADLVGSFDAAARQIPAVTGPEIWKDMAQPVDTRVADLLCRLSLAEKVAQMGNAAPAIPRLGIPAYNYWNEALHGVARAGAATVFPQAIGAAATWDAPLLHAEAEVIATEARAKYNDYAGSHHGDTDEYHGLTFWSPNLNIFRDPRWGRGQETYGEDPYLTGTMGVAFIRGLQGDDPRQLRALACAKHFVVHSGPEPTRHSFDAQPPERDLYETYLPHFEMAVRDGRVGGVMGSYNSIFGVPACANSFLLTDVLRRQWGFDGYIVSDCGAIDDIFAHHKFTATPEEAAAAAAKAGCDICCGNDYGALTRAAKEGLITAGEIDRALGYALKARFRLGLFNPSAVSPYAAITLAQNDTPAHEALALQVARESVVLLQNDGLLPLDRTRFKRIAVIGMNADSIPALVGNYNGTPARPVTLLAGIRRVAGPGVGVVYAPGCPLACHPGGDPAEAGLMAAAVAVARTADVIIYAGGISAELEGEESPDDSTCDGFKGGDRTRIELPPGQTTLLQALQATGKPVVFVNCSGSAVAMPWAVTHLPAIVQAWYPGEQGGQAVAEVLFGEVNPGGRLPVTFYQSTADLPDFSDYGMSHRTYRYFDGQPEFAFGHGLSYTRFDYGDARLNATRFQPDGMVKVSFTLENTGARDGDEVAQVYFHQVHSARPQARLALCGFTRLHLPKGTGALVTVDIPVQRFRQWDTVRKQYVVEPGKYELLIGGGSDDIRRRTTLKVEAAK